MRAAPQQVTRGGDRECGGGASQSKGSVVCPPTATTVPTGPIGIQTAQPSCDTSAARESQESCCLRRACSHTPAHVRLPGPLRPPLAGLVFAVRGHAWRDAPARPLQCSLSGHLRVLPMHHCRVDALRVSLRSRVGVRGRVRPAWQGGRVAAGAGVQQRLVVGLEQAGRHAAAQTGRRRTAGDVSAAAVGRLPAAGARPVAHRCTQAYPGQRTDPLGGFR